MLRQEWRRKSLDPQISDPKSMYEAFINSTAQFADCGRRSSAKVYLHQLCSAQQWKQPIFECCDEEGPAHLKRYTFKVSVLSKEGHMILESFGNPQKSKKAAAEDAAEGALWCFKHMGISL